MSTQLVITHILSIRAIMAALLVVTVLIFVPAGRATAQSAADPSVPPAALDEDELLGLPAYDPADDPYAAILATEIPEPDELAREPDPLTERPAQAVSFDMRDAVERGLEANPQILSARAQILGSEYGRKAALGELGFKIDLSYSYEYRNTPLNTTTSVGGTPVVVDQGNFFVLNMNVTQPLFSGFRLLSRYQRAKLAKDQAQAILADAELQLIQIIQTEFLALLQARMDVKSAQDAVARLESQLKVTSAFFDVGLRPRFDVLQAEVELATAEQDLLIAQNRVDTQIARLNTLLDLPIDFPADYVCELGYIPFEMRLNQALERAYKLRPDLDIARKSVEIAQKDVKIVASDFYPSINGEFNWFSRGDGPLVSGSDVEPDDFREWTVGASANWNLFEWGATYHSYREAKEDVSQLEADLANTRLEASFEVKANLLNIQEARDRIRVAKKAVEAAREGYRTALARYRAQVSTITDVLDAQSRVTESEAQLTQALTDYQTAIADLYVSVGERVPTLSPM